MTDRGNGEVDLVLETLAKIDQRVDRVLLNDAPYWDQLFWMALDGAGLTGLDGAEHLGIARAAARSCAALRRRVPLAERVLIAGPIARANNWELPAGVVAVASSSSTARVDARVEDGCVVLDGTTSGVPWAPIADHVLLTIAEGDSLHTMFAPVRNVGATQTPGGHPEAEIEFGAQAIPLTHVSSVPVSAGDPLLEHGALARSVQCVGAIEGVLAMAVEYAGQRVQFGKPIGRFQAVQHMLAELAGESAVAGAALSLAAAEGSGAKELATAKLCVSAAAAAAIRIGHQVHGAIGFTDDYPLGVLSRSLHSWRGDFGGEAYWADRLFEVLEGQDASLWSVVSGVGSM